MFKEISRKCEMREKSGIAYGPFSIIAVVAEMVIEEAELKNTYLLLSIRSLRKNYSKKSCGISKKSLNGNP